MPHIDVTQNMKCREQFLTDAVIEVRKNRGGLRVSSVPARSGICVPVNTENYHFSRDRSIIALSCDTGRTHELLRIVINPNPENAWACRRF